MVEKMKVPEIDKEFFLSLVNDEIEEELIEQNFALVQLMQEEKFEECCFLRDEIKIFILDSSRILQSHIGGKTQTYFTRFQNKNKEIYKEMIGKILDI